MYSEDRVNRHLGRLTMEEERGEQLFCPRFLAEHVVLLSTATGKRSFEGKDQELKRAGIGCVKSGAQVWGGWSHVSIILTVTSKLYSNILIFLMNTLRIRGDNLTS